MPFRSYKLTLDNKKQDNKNLPLYKGKKVAVVIPAHNEEVLISETIAGIPEYVARIYVVNDCSTDRTQEVVESYAKYDESIVPIQHEVNKGPGAAIVSGYKKSLDDRMDIVVTLDGDNQMDPVLMPLFLDPIVEGKCDFTKGNRLLSPDHSKDMSRWRYFGNSVLSLLTKISSGYWSIVDPQNGYTAISRRALQEIDIDKLYPGYGYLNDRLVRLNVFGFRIINIPHPARYGKEKSGIKYSTYIYRVSGLLLKNFLWRLKMKYIQLHFHPLVLLYIFGILFCILAGIGGIFSLFHTIFRGFPILMSSVMLFILLCLGLLMIFFAMFFDSRQEKEMSKWYT